MQNYEKFLLIMVMHQEAQPTIEYLNMQKKPNILDEKLPASVYQVTKNNKELTLVLSDVSPKYGVPRVGAQAAALLAWEAIKTFSPHLVINAGTAGGFGKGGAKIGDVYLSTKFICYHDREYNPKNENFIRYSIGRFNCLEMPEIASHLGLKTGVITTGATMYYTDKELERIVSTNAIVKEMEAAAIAEVAELRNIPFIAIKSITDIVDSGKCTQEQFEKNFSFAVANLTQKLEAILDLFLQK